MKDYAGYVNVFHGCGEIDPKPEGIAARWYFIKAGCGNTNPAACLPFSAVSAGPFSGGYPTGYGDHLPNSFARPAHFPGGKGLLGFSHLQHSGTGAIGYYYNYAVVTPRYPDSPERREPVCEAAEPGYYMAVLEDIRCELTVTGRTALHRYTFGHGGGFVTVDFSNNGLNIPGRERAGAENLSVWLEDEGTAAAEADIEGVRIHMAVRADAGIRIGDGKARIEVPENGIVNLAVSLSPRDMARALEQVRGTYDFDEAQREAYRSWNEKLSLIDIETDDERVRRIFYSNLYHSLIKPSDWTDESFLYGDGPFTADLATLWDMYKTALPLIYMIDGDMGAKISETLLRVCETEGVMPVELGLSRHYEHTTSQARMLGFYVLFTAYRFGYPTDVKRLLADFRLDLFAEGKRDFTEGGRCASHTFLLDMAEACTLAADIARETGDTDTEELLRPYGKLWERAYSRETGLLGADSSYYEGTLYNYSFRQMADMDARIALAGGKERFVKLLDDFFGYGAPPVVLPTDPHDGAVVSEGMKLGRFEGFNNESDTEAPFSYVYAGRHDRTCEIVRAGMKCLFTEGRGGIPGNNDSGALSSYYVLMALGLFPVAGQDLFLMGSPFVKSARIRLYTGGVLEIGTDGVSDERIYVKSVRFNGRELHGFRIPAGELMRGGKLEFCMTDRPEG